MNHEPGSVATHRRQLPRNPGLPGRTATANRKCSNEPWCGRTDGRGEIKVKAHKGETITAAPGFYIIGGHNPNVHGAVLTEALSSRFTVQVKVGTDYDLARALKIDPRAITAAEDLARRQAGGEIGWSPQLRELIGYARTAAALGESAAAANLAGIAPGEDQDVVAAALRKAFGRTITPLALGRQV